MFAFTSLNHMGFVIFGAFATVASGSLLGVEGATLQMFVHTFTAGSLFMLTGYLHEQTGTSEIPLLKGLRMVHAAHGWPPGLGRARARWRSRLSPASSQS